MKGFTITIKGAGEHHGDKASDVDEIARKCVEDLKAAGHEVHHATISIDPWGTNLLEEKKAK